MTWSIWDVDHEGTTCFFGIPEAENQPPEQQQAFQTDRINAEAFNDNTSHVEECADEVYQFFEKVFIVQEPK